MGMEQLGSPQEKAARRPEVDRVKKLIKEGDLLKPRDPDFPSTGTGEKNVVRSFGIQGVETVDDLFNRTEAPNYDPHKAQEALRVMSTAVYESMIESGDPDLMEAVIAGSYSTERLLPPEWVGSDASDPENGSRFASMVTQNFLDKFTTEPNRARVFAALETLDYLRNNPDLGTEDFYRRQARETHKSISEVAPMGRSEIEARAWALEYVDGVIEGSSDTEKAVDNGKKIKKTGKKIERDDDEGDESAKEQMRRIEREVDENFSAEQIWEMARKDYPDLIGEDVGAVRMPEKMPTGLSEEEQKKWLKDKENEARAIRATKNRLILQRMEDESGVDAGEKERTCTLNDVYEWLDHIEKSSKESNDLTINAEYLRLLFDVKMKPTETRRPLRIRDLDGKKVWIRDPEALQKANGETEIRNIPHVEVQLTQEMVAREITWRLYLHDLYLSTSSVKDIEGIAKLMIGMHHGDVNGEQDRDFITFFLNDGANGMPVAEAWDWRQRAYYHYGDLLREVADNDPDLLARHGYDRDTFIKLDPLMRRDEEFGIYEDLMGNMRCDLEVRRNMVEEYMAKRIAAGFTYSDKPGDPPTGRIIPLERAQKAVELAKRLSSATYQDSAANFAFVDGDDYAELILFKWLRYQDGVEISPKEVKISYAKSKPTGSPKTIKYIDTLTPSWLFTVAGKDLMTNPDRANERGIGKPLYSRDINGRKINGKSDSVYHFFPIIMKKVQNAKMLFMDEQKPGDILLRSNVQKNFERLNKTISEATKAGWFVLDPRFMPETMHDMRAAGGDKLKRSVLDMEMQRTFRTWYVANALDLAGSSPGLGWDLFRLEDAKLLYSVRKFFRSSVGEEAFISSEQWKFCESISNVRNMLGSKMRREERMKSTLGFMGKIKL